MAADPIPTQTPASSTLSSTLHLLRATFNVDPRAFLTTVSVSLAGSLAEGLSFVLLLPLLAAAGMDFPATGLPGRITTVAQGFLRRSGLPPADWLGAALLAFLLAGTLRSLLRRIQSTLLYTTTNAIELTLSRRLYAAVVHAQWSYLVRQRGGSFTHLLTEQLSKLAESILLLFMLINAAGLTLLYLFLALRLSAPMTLLVLALGGAIMILQRRSLARSRASGDALNRSVAEVYAATEEHLLNLKAVKTYEAEARDIDSYAALCERVVRHSLASAKHQAGAAFRFELGSLVGLAAVLFLALNVLHVQAATLLLLLAIFTRLMPQLSALQSQTHQFAVALPAYDQVRRLEAECLAHSDAPTPAANTIRIAPLARELRINNLWFAYPPPDPTAEPPFVLRGVDLTLEAGLLTAISGESGSGKSTLADILTGLLTPSRGVLSVDGEPLTPAGLRSWRSHIGYVGQDTVLFHQSIRENLLWACPAASEQDIHDALRLAAAGFVYDLPHGLASVAGDRGILLSSGQRQRLALARALLRRPSLLILDEATNALDPDNEARILDALLEALAAAPGRLTILMIAHRASALARAHRIFHLESGMARDLTIPQTDRLAGTRP